MHNRRSISCKTKHFLDYAVVKASVSYGRFSFLARPSPASEALLSVTSSYMKKVLRRQLRTSSNPHRPSHNGPANHVCGSRKMDAPNHEGHPLPHEQAIETRHQFAIVNAGTLHPSSASKLLLAERLFHTGCVELDGRSRLLSSRKTRVLGIGRCCL
jgi:hypothetical protein